jgi:hypothetical protein
MHSIRAARVVFAVGACAAFASVAGAQPASTPSAEVRRRVAPQGFSVVLVLGESQPPPAADTVPAAARRALADMKDFLPYKGYRLLDAQWILGSQKSTMRLRGPDDQDLQLTLRGTQEAGGIRVVFQLQEPGAAELSAAEAATMGERQARLAALRDRLYKMQAETAQEGARGGRQPAAVRLAREAEALKQEVARLEGAMPAVRGRAVIDTSFSMDVGETVVVGTSRVRGDKALIALLTAVAHESQPKRE